MESVWRMAPPANTSGPLLMVLMNFPQFGTSCCTCLCVTGSTNGNRISSFVGQNYFCETGITRYNGILGTIWSNGDPLWDGQRCGPTSSCCAFNSPPWFSVRLSSYTTDYIEVRICNNDPSARVGGNDSCTTHRTLREMSWNDQHCEQLNWVEFLVVVECNCI